MMPLTEDQIERLVERGARKALTEFFEIFGVDVSTPDVRREFAEDLSFLRTARQGSARFRAVTITTIGGSIITGLTYLIFKGLATFGFVVTPK